MVLLEQKNYFVTGPNSSGPYIAAKYMIAPCPEKSGGETMLIDIGKGSVIEQLRLRIFDPVDGRISGPASFQDGSISKNIIWREEEFHIICNQYQDTV